MAEADAPVAERLQVGPARRDARGWPWLQVRIGRAGVLNLFDERLRRWREPTAAEMAELEARLTLVKLHRMQPGA